MPGISGGLASIFEQTTEDWQEILRVNLIGPFLAIKHAAPAMKEMAADRSSARQALRGSARAREARLIRRPKRA
jgi:NAD(P)-dependent dehydrogenase (short-subunit alcohol dehydrogenase family)